MAFLHQGNHPTELGLFAWTFAWNQQTFEDRGNSCQTGNTHTHVLHLQVCSICTHLNNVGLDFSHCMLAFKSNSFEEEKKNQVQVYSYFLKWVSHSFVFQSFHPARFLCPWDYPGKIVEWVAIPSSRGSLGHRVEPRSLSLHVDSLPS